MGISVAELKERQEYAARQAKEGLKPATPAARPVADGDGPSGSQVMRFLESLRDHVNELGEKLNESVAAAAEQNAERQVELEGLDAKIDQLGEELRAELKKKAKK